VATALIAAGGVSGPGTSKRGLRAATPVCDLSAAAGIPAPASSMILNRNAALGMAGSPATS